ncbi:MAG: methylmalonyl-CoA mutase [Acidobacteria bacterium]|nr:MAG: methylmalonyl-CoA mutase [Acidobacteriota bacterium]
MKLTEKQSSQASERKKEFTTVSGKNVRALYRPEDLQGFEYREKLADPGHFPFTRGIYPTMYRGRLWTMRQFSGFGTPEETNKRFKFLLSQGQTGLSVAFDLPTLMGLDSSDPLSEGEVGKCGVAVDTVEDMQILFDGIDLGEVSTSMTINAPAAVLLAMYVVVAERQGVPSVQLRGTLQNDILKEYIAQKEWIYPPEPSMRLVIDTIQYCAEQLPQFNSISISGYHIREAGSTALQELAFTLRDGIEYVEWCRERGMAVDAFAPRLSFFFNCHNDFLEEVAKFRAARRLWAHTMRDRFSASDPKSLMCRFHTQTAGCSLTAQQPFNNVIRTTIQALAAVMGGTNSLHTNSLDEALALPTEQAAQIALRTQQIIAHESGVTNSVDPLAGSYLVEAFTDEMEAGARRYFSEIDAMGGMISAIQRGFPQKEIQESAYRFQKAVEARDQVVVGVNQSVAEDEEPIHILKIGPEAEQAQRERLRQTLSRRNRDAVSQSLAALRKAAATDQNLMPFLLSAVREYATLGELCSSLREVFGSYQEPEF